MGRRLTRRESVLLVGLSAVLVLVLLGGFWLRPEFEHMQALQQQVTQLTAEAQQAVQTNTSAGVKASGNSSETGESLVSKRLPSGIDEPQLLSALAQLQMQTRVQITSIQQASSSSLSSPTTSQTGTESTAQTTSGQTSTLQSLPLALQIQGNTTEIEQFLAGIRSMSRLVEVNNLTLSATTAGKASGSLQLSAFYQ